MGCQYESYSVDEGLSWTMPVPSRFTSPAAPMSMKRIPGSNKLLTVWNPVPNYNGRKTSTYGGRTPLVLATCNDDGIDWNEPISIEDNPDAGYCYTAIHFLNDNHMLLAYCAGNEDGTGSQNLMLRKIPINELP